VSSLLVKEREGTCGASAPENRMIRTALKQVMLFCKKKILMHFFLIFHLDKRWFESCSSRCFAAMHNTDSSTASRGFQAGNVQNANRRQKKYTGGIRFVGG
jgi:hypothetical protein